MRQIPTSGEWCGNCPMIPNETGYSDDCSYYVDTLEWKSGNGYLRLPQCLKERPQVLTEEERNALINAGVAQTSLMLKLERQAKGIPEMLIGVVK
jgi:hypothetical protein